MINYLLHIVHNPYMINCLLSITYRAGKKEGMQEERKGGGRKEIRREKHTRISLHE